MSKIIRRYLVLIFIITLSTVSIPSLNYKAFAATSESYNFDTAGDLATYFDVTQGSGSYSQTLTGGIGNSGAINAPGSLSAVFASKNSYSIGSAGSTYTFTSYMQSIGNAGYSGVGFSATPSSSGARAQYRPNDALGISVHGGGFVFHNGATDYNGDWHVGGTGITSVKTYQAQPGATEINGLLNQGSAVDWYKVIFKIEVLAGALFNIRVEVWPALADGTLIRPGEADAIYEVRSISNATISGAPTIKSYINFSGDRVRYFDNFAINLGGNASIISAGYPVVVTNTQTVSGNQVTLNGNVTSENGSTVTERGFVYANTDNPTLTDNKVVSGSGTGTFSETVNSLAAGTYFARTYATNTTGTSYGSSVTFTIAAPIPTPTIGSVSPSTGSTAGGTAITITGTNFAAGATITVGGAACTDVVVVSATSITCTTPTGSAGAKDVVVTNTDTGTVTSTGGFTYQVPISTPTIGSVSPSTGSTAGGTAITITGTNFAAGATITVGGAACTDVVVVSATSITCTTPTGSAGAKDVVVTNTDTGTVTSMGGFTFSSPSPRREIPLPTQTPEPASPPIENIPPITANTAPTVLTGELIPFDSPISKDPTILPPITLPVENVIGNPQVIEANTSVAASILPNSSSTGLDIVANGWGLQIAGKPAANSIINVDNNKNIIANPGIGFNLNGEGFDPSSYVKVYIFSSPILLGTFKTDANGNFVSELPLPSGLVLGKHIIQVSGFTKDKNKRDAFVGLVVVKKQNAKIVIPFGNAKFNIGKDQLKAIKSLDFQDKHKVVLNGYASGTSGQDDMRISLFRALEVKKLIQKLHPNIKVMTYGRGTSKNRSCEKFRNRCAVISVI